MGSKMDRFPGRLRVSLDPPLVCQPTTIIHWSHIIRHENDDHETSVLPDPVETETFLRCIIPMTHLWLDFPQD